MSDAQRSEFTSQCASIIAQVFGRPAPLMERKGMANSIELYSPGFTSIDIRSLAKAFDKAGMQCNAFVHYEPSVNGMTLVMNTLLLKPVETTAVAQPTTKDNKIFTFCVLLLGCCVAILIHKFR